ncbi:PTS sugar transporter subunit IIA [Tetragenococcus koreensis]|uniref:PTS sugar transporter subunit IIA n=1 Tax=Tetragenococcus koreensis TaxID=290335 RepID=UPI000F4F9C80|nr:PTS sugar transporter subunit IIA [Tetragenococcus koreensis]AYW46513.1 hypothetical protein C7K43_11605 [Tetragenococcus koreensis]MCF1585341.1 PTS sugar transporter subunit IIA [Tetragenococcus koreensis]MCF1619755.1 PTS sugar transporter subunit IIA [Tetragenococcus koreensis]MCF1629606.1 PTS sugar transporter subunit IIA [Tetragenococcus koreensis]MCF1657238.1 PTS sugar transporter subunit IIA [Tetragenococcus koreensis]
MLEKLITSDTYQYTETDLDWKEAIRYASEPLLAKGYITNKYIEKMIDNVEKLGPFIYLGKGIAIPHARPEFGVNETSMSVLRVKKPVLLLNDSEYAIKTFIVLAAGDNDKHLEALKQLTNILTVDKYVEKINNSNNFSDIEIILKENNGEEE